MLHKLSKFAETKSPDFNINNYGVFHTAVKETVTQDFWGAWPARIGLNLKINTYVFANWLTDSANWLTDC